MLTGRQTASSGPSAASPNKLNDVSQMLNYFTTKCFHQKRWKRRWNPWNNVYIMFGFRSKQADSVRAVPVFTLCCIFSFWKNVLSYLCCFYCETPSLKLPHCLVTKETLFFLQSHLSWSADELQPGVPAEQANIHWRRNKFTQTHWQTHEWQDPVPHSWELPLSGLALCVCEKSNTFTCFSSSLE